MLSVDTVAERLRVAREASGLTQRDLSVRAGLSNAYVSQVERGIGAERGDSGIIWKPSTEALQSLADVLSVRVEWLAFGSGPMRGNGGEDAAE